MDFYNIIGSAGAGLYLLSYALLNTKKIPADGPLYIALNLTAALCMLVSLTANWNGPSFFAQVCWVALSIYGLFNCYAKRMLSQQVIEFAQTDSSS